MITFKIGKLGAVALAISAEVNKASFDSVIAKGLASECYRAAASKVYGPKGHARDEAYSQSLAADVVKAIELVLNPLCSALEVSESKYIAPEKKAALTVEDVLASLSDEQLTAALEARKAKVEASEDSIG